MQKKYQNNNRIQEEQTNRKKYQKNALIALSFAGSVVWSIEPSGYKLTDSSGRRGSSSGSRALGRVKGRKKTKRTTNNNKKTKTYKKNNRKHKIYKKIPNNTKIYKKQNTTKTENRKKQEIQIGHNTKEYPNTKIYNNNCKIPPKKQKIQNPQNAKNNNKYKKYPPNTRSIQKYQQ